MKLKPLVIALVVVGALAAFGGGSYGLYRFGMQRGIGMAGGVTSAAAAEPGSANAAPTAAAGPQSIAQGEDATRRHIQAGLKAGDVDPSTAARSSITTTRWRRATSSTSRPSHRSWT